MPYLLRIIVCLYFGFASISVWADGLTEMAAEMRARGVAQKAALAAGNALVEKAWSCDPVIHQDKIVNWKFRETKADGQLESADEGRTRLFRNLLEFRGCPDENGNEQMSKAFIDKYVCAWFSEGNWIQSEVINKEIPELISGVQLCTWHVSSGTDYESDVKFHEGLREKRELEVRKTQLKNGVMPVSSFEDAILFYEPNELRDVMNSPLLRPDNALYAAGVRVDGDEGDLVRVKIGDGRNAFGGWVEVAYAALRITKKTKSYSRSGMRIGGAIAVIGRYVQNKKYKTLAGQWKMMPVIEVMYIRD